MVDHRSIFEDFEASLKKLEGVLRVSDHKLAGFVQDAQIHCFQTSVSILRYLIQSLVNPNEEPDGLVTREKLFEIMCSFAERGIITEEQFKKFGMLFLYNTILTINIADLPPGEELDLYKEGAQKIASCYHLMNEFLVNLYANGEFASVEEDSDVVN